MKTRMITFILLLLAAFVMAACSPGADEAPAPAAETMAEAKNMAEDEMMAEEETMADESMAEDEMMAENQHEGSDEMMAEEETMAGEEMMDGEGEMAAESMENDGEMGAEGEMAAGADAESAEMMAGDMMQAALTLELSGLAALGEGWAYEGWLIVDGAPVSTGVFTIDEAMMASAAEFEVDGDALAQASAFVLTIEPSPDPDPAPSQTHLLGGDFVDDSAALTVGHPTALAADFAATDSAYILGIPSSDSADDSYTGGIWFTGLNLPALPAGWVYEGWVVGPDGPISTGRFAAADQADSDGTGPTAGPNPGPAYPGQDFLNPAIDLTSGYAAVISIEPQPDDSPAPFALKPLLDEDIEAVGDHVPQDFGNNAATFPTGTATR